MLKPLPSEWVEKIFMKMHGRFGNAFFDQYRIGQLNEEGEDIGILNARNEWAEGLGHLSIERIKRGLEALYDFPPSRDKFIKACTPVPEKFVSAGALPKPANDAAVIQRNREKIYAMMNFKKIPN